MKHKYNRWIMGTAIGIAAIAAAVDHTRHRLQAPEPAKSSATQKQASDTSANPCGLNVSPCGLN